MSHYTSYRKQSSKKVTFSEIKRIFFYISVFSWNLMNFPHFLIPWVNFKWTWWYVLSCSQFVLICVPCGEFDSGLFSLCKTHQKCNILLTVCLVVVVLTITCYFINLKKKQLSLSVENDLSAKVFWLWGFVTALWQLKWHPKVTMKPWCWPSCCLSTTKTGHVPIQK